MVGEADWERVRRHIARVEFLAYKTVIELMEENERLRQENALLRQRQPDSLEATCNDYQQAAAECVALLRQAGQIGIHSVDAATAARCIRVLGQLAKRYHAALWNAVSQLKRAEQTEDVIIERQRLLGEIRRFELEHHQLLKQLDALATKYQHSIPIRR